MSRPPPHSIAFPAHMGSSGNHFPAFSELIQQVSMTSNPDSTSSTNPAPQKGRRPSQANAAGALALPPPPSSTAQDAGNRSQGEVNNASAHRTHSPRRQSKSNQPTQSGGPESASLLSSVHMMLPPTFGTPAHLLGTMGAGSSSGEVDQGTVNPNAKSADPKVPNNGKSPVLGEVLEEDDGQSVVSDDFEETPMLAAKRSLKSVRTMSQSKGIATHSAKEKEKRKRQVQSCSECRRRKIKCDKKFPCGPCVLRNDQSICREVEKHNTSSTGCASAQEVMHLQQRLAALETILSEAGLMSHGDVENLMGTRGKLPLGPSGLAGSTLAATLAAGPELDLESDTEGAALTLEHLAFGQRKVEQTGPGPNAYGPTYPRPLSESSKTTLRARSNSNMGMGSNADNRLERGSSTDNTRALETRPVDFLAFGAGNALGIGMHRDSGVGHSAMADAIPQSMISSTTGGISANLLPSKPLNLKQHLYKPINSAVLNALEPTEVFSLFYQRSDIFVKALLAVLPDRRRGEILVRNYLERVEWQHRCLHVPTFLRQCNELWNTPLAHVVHEVYTPFLSLYIIICCLGLYFMDPAEAQKYFTPDECESLPEIWLTAARGSLWMSDFMAVHTLEHLQCIVVMGVFLNNRDRADAAWSLLGAAIKMAQGMGLSRLGAEADPSSRDPPKWRTPWESVVKREVGRRLWWNLVFLDWSLAPSYNFSSSIQPDQIKTALPANVNDEDISDLHPLEPKPLSVRTDMSYHLARLRFAEISQRQIWQANASPHPPYSFILSVDTELRKAISNLPSYFSFDLDNIEPPPSDPRERIFYWEKITINLSAQSRLMRLHRPWLSRGYKDRNDDCKAKHSEVLAALARMEQITTMSHPARGSVKVIRQLLHELEEKQQGKAILGKRKAEDDGWPASAGGLQRAVKKLITDNGDSPTSSVNLVCQNTATSTSGSPKVSTTGQSKDQSGLSSGSRDKDANYGTSYEAQLHNILPPDLSTNAFQQYFPMEISYGANAGVASSGQFPNYENAELESMLASYLPSRPHSPDDLLARLNNQSGVGDHQQNMWQGNPSSSGAPDLNFDLNALANPYRGWMN
ncbi:hypothetical protein QFC19_007755 [Naganishia cerealis]|uniref:Uncharacterized protein n=1 Tax=Naganishia cerealis TaxID=610337 RepID=A0ACC2V6B3_9TREE|nr:hypothetical protein QFC19_007755 [Naganishia cerealis]